MKNFIIISSSSCSICSSSNQHLQNKILILLKLVVTVSGKEYKVYYNKAGEEVDVAKLLKIIQQQQLQKTHATLETILILTELQNV